MSIGFTFSNRKANGDLFPLLEDFHYLRATKTIEPLPAEPYWEGEPYALGSTYYFTNGTYNCEYMYYTTGAGARGACGTYFYGEAPHLTSETNYSNPIRPIISKELWKYPLTAGSIIVATAMASINIIDTDPSWGQFDRTFLGTNPMTFSEVHTNFSNLSASVGLLGINFERGYNDYRVISADALPQPILNGTSQKYDFKELVSAFYDYGRECDALAFFPVIEGMTVTPGTAIGPEFMVGLWESTYQNTVPMESLPSPTGTAKCLRYEWDVPIVNIGAARLTATNISIPANLRVDYYRVPAGQS